MKRIFLAIKIIPETRLHGLFQNLRDELIHENIKWVDLNNLHLTLKFFGETEEVKINQINLFLENLVAKMHSFSFEISNLGVFGSSYQPKVVWLGIKENQKLTSVAETILNDLKLIDFERDRQNFVPHLSLGRIKSLTDKEKFKQLISKYNTKEIQTVNVKEIYLLESILRKEGPLYKTINNYKLII